MLSTYAVSAKNRSKPTDGALVDRLKRCLTLAKIDQLQAPAPYQASGEWPYLLNLDSADKGAEYLSNMFRDQSLTAIGANYSVRGIGKLSLRGAVKGRLIAQGMSMDLAIWRAVVGGAIDQLEAPDIGNPWGVVVDGKLLYPGVCRADYFAAHVANLLDNLDIDGTVLEIGGGYGEFAYRLMKRRPQVKYICLDLPEVLLKSSYFLMNAFPEKRFRLYDNPADDFNVAMLPNFMLPTIEADITINTRSLSEMGRATVNEYIWQICRNTRHYFAHENSNEPIATHGGHIEVPAAQFLIRDFAKVYGQKSPWWAGSGSTGRYVEYLYERSGHQP